MMNGFDLICDRKNRLFPLPYFRLLLLMALMAIGINGGAANVADPIDLTTDLFHKWNGVGKDASKTTDEIGEFDVNLGKELTVGTVLGPVNGGVLKETYADLSIYNYIHLEGTAGVQVRFVFNRQTDADSNNGIEEFTVTIPENGSVECALSQIKSDFKHLNSIKMGWGSPSGQVTKLQVYKGYNVQLTCDDATKVNASWTVEGDDKTRYIDAWSGNLALNQKKISFTSTVNYDCQDRYLVKWNIGSSTKEWNNDFVYAVNPDDADADGNIYIKLVVAEGMKMTVGVRDGVPPAAKDHVGVKHDFSDNINGVLLHKGTKVTFFAEDYEAGTFNGWYKAMNGTETPVSTEKEYTCTNLSEDLTLYAGYTPKSISEERTLMVDGKVRKYWLHVPASVAGKKDVPVVFSLHGRFNNDDPVSTNEKGEIKDTGKPIFTSLAEKEGFIVVYPQGRDGGSEVDKKDYPGNWYEGFGGSTGWEATGKKNADTDFIQALVDEIKKNQFGHDGTTVDGTKFYLCGFSMGGMMTYACANVLNGTFAAYGSCSGFPMNEFHMDLATENPIPFIHLHGTSDNIIGIKHLNTAIENLLFRNGCNLADKGKLNQMDWNTSTANGETHHFKRYDFMGVNDVPVTTVTFEGLWHSVEASAPQYLWSFFKDKTTNSYDSDIEWKWDMPTINQEIASMASRGSDVYTYGWHRVVGDSERTLTYGDEKNVACTVTSCTSAATGCNGNHNVYHSIQLPAGKHTLYAQAKVEKNGTDEGFVSITLENNLTGAEVVARKLVNNTGTANADMHMLYEFEVGEGAEYSIVINRSYTNSACTFLEIHRGAYKPKNVTDQSLDNATCDIQEGKLVELTFENGSEGVDVLPLTKDNGAGLTSADGGMKLYLKSRLGIKDGQIDNKDKYIVQDPIFGHYFQNMPDADIYDRTSEEDYMRVVLGDKNSLSGHDGVAGIHETGKITIGFWVNGALAVKRGLSYWQPSMFYVAGNEYNGSNKENNPHMFNIKCDGALTGYMDGGNYQYSTKADGFGDLCDTESSKDFYHKNFYKDCNWHYITYQMYDNLSRYNMYVDGEPTSLGGYVSVDAAGLKERIDGLKSIVLGGANASNVSYAYDVPFAYDDIVIYNRVLSQREINEIIKQKKYTPAVWNFEENMQSTTFFEPEEMDQGLWIQQGDTYTLNADFATSAALTYDGIHEIPAFKGLQFVTNGTSKIAIDAKTGALKLSQGVKIVFSNMVKDNYVRMTHKALQGDPWKDYVNSNMGQIAGLDYNREGYQRTAFKVMATGEGVENSVTMPVDIEINNMEATSTYFAQIRFVEKTNTNKIVEVVKNPKVEDLPRMDFYINGVERLHKENPETHRFLYSSSSPHVATVDANGNVTLKGVAGSTVITAELVNDAQDRKYDCDVYDKYAYEPSNRIFASYKLVVSPKDGASYHVADNKDYQVGETLYNKDKTVGATLGGWTYGDNATYYNNYTDAYSRKEAWTGEKFEKKEDGSGYLENSRTTEQGVFPELFSTDGSFSTNGSLAAKSEQLNGTAEGTYASTGNYVAPTDNKSVSNETPWLLPCRGSHIKIEPTAAGMISVYVMQEGCVSHGTDGEPNDVTVRRVYVADEKGEIVKQVVADTESKVAAQIWNADGRARAEYNWGDPSLSYNKALYDSFYNMEWNDKWSFLDNWPNPGMRQHVFKVGKDEDGHVVITKGIVRYTFNVLPGKTYYIFSNTAKLGFAGFTFEKGKHATYKLVKPDAKHEEWRATGEITTVNEANVTLEDDKDFSEYSEIKNAQDAEVTLARTFYKNYWNAICLPYSMNRRQVEEAFGNGTKLVLMKSINEATKKVTFVQHANQDIIAGYPYLIFPTTKEDAAKNDHSEINGVKTRATFGEANEPLFTVGTDGQTYQNGSMQADALIFKGIFAKEVMPVGSFGITKTGKLSPVGKAGLSMKPYRSYIHFNQTTPGAKAISLTSMGFSDFDGNGDTATSIEDILFENGILTKSSDVYTVSGVKVRSHADNLKGLPKGVYIVNGKKYVYK